MKAIVEDIPEILAEGQKVKRTMDTGGSLLEDKTDAPSRSPITRSFGPCEKFITDS